MSTLYTLTGPTSSGKTALALRICRKLDGEIVSADSRQIYKYMDIGTGKIPVGNSAADTKVVRRSDHWVINGVTVWGYDLVTPDQTYSAYDYAVFTRNKLNSLLTAGKSAFLVGGTGFYVDAVLGRLQLDASPANLVLRAELEREDCAVLYERLLKLDQRVAAGVDQFNKRRVVRALEKLLSARKVPGESGMLASSSSSTLPTAHDTRLSPADWSRVIQIGLTAPRDTLYSRADSWLDNVWVNGLLTETVRLISMGYRDTPRLSGLVYKSVIDYLDHIRDEKEAKERIKFDLHAYIRRQQTWFKRNKDTVWLDISEDSVEEKVYNLIRHE